MYPALFLVQGQNQVELWFSCVPFCYQDTTFDEFNYLNIFGMEDNKQRQRESKHLKILVIRHEKQSTEKMTYNH